MTTISTGVPPHLGRRGLGGPDDGELVDRRPGRDPARRGCLLGLGAPQAAGTQATERLITIASLTPITAPGAVMVIGLVMMLAGLVQAVLMMFREAAVIILAGVVVLAAAGSFTGATRPWLPKVLGWLLALIAYKPAAALVYPSALAL